MTGNEKIVVDVEADTSKFDASMDQIQASVAEFGTTFSRTLQASIIDGKSFEDTLRSIGAALSQVALKAALKPLGNIASDFFASLIGAPTTQVDDGVYGPVAPVPFAKGGIVATPSYFNFPGGTGLMGEAGAEAILPLSRGPDGKLGIAAGNSDGRSMNVVFNVNATDAGSFQRSESQITAMLARAVSRGRRNL